MTTPDMLALVVRGHRRHDLERLPVPEPGPAEALVAARHAAMCGTDLKLLAGALHDAGYPVIPGHEWVGEVLAASSRPELVGRRVTAENIVPCERCGDCAAGRPNLCAEIDEVGFTRPGAFAEVFTVPADSLVPLPDGLPDAEGCLLEPLGVALHAVERAGELIGRRVGVIGGGTVGLLVAQLAIGGGADDVSVVEPYGSRRAVAVELGVTAYPALDVWAGDEPDLVFDATGVAAVFPAGVAATRAGGTYVLVGYSGEEATRFEPAALMLRELTVRGVLSGHGQLRAALAAVAAGTVRLGPLVSDPLPLSDYRAVLDRTGDEAPLRCFFALGARPARSASHFSSPAKE